MQSDGSPIYKELNKVFQMACDRLFDSRLTRSPYLVPILTHSSLTAVRSIRPLVPRFDIVKKRGSVFFCCLMILATDLHSISMPSHRYRFDAKVWAFTHEKIKKSLRDVDEVIFSFVVQLDFAHCLAPHDPDTLCPLYFCLQHECPWLLRSQETSEL